MKEKPSLVVAHRVVNQSRIFSSIIMSLHVPFAFSNRL
jgi:hypothetical protein